MQPKHVNRKHLSGQEGITVALLAGFVRSRFKRRQGGNVVAGKRLC